MSFTEFETPTKFEITNTVTWGVDKDKFSGYSVPIALNDETKEQLRLLVDEHNTNNPIYGNTMYLKSKALSEKQSKELFKQGRQQILVHFKAMGVYTKGDKRYLTFKITKLRRLEKPEASTSCPED